MLTLFRVYKQNIERTFDPQDISILVSGTLLLLISCLFMNGGAGQEIVYVDGFNSPNNIVMNTVIAASASGLTMVAINQWSNVFSKEQVLQQTGMIQQNNVFNLCNSIISGLVSITGCCNSASLYGSAIIGLIGCLIYQ